ncbi:hypothetical protein GDO81_007314 [Engystomops pustulosus]|uniref:Uncharacterized protein n=1 Tax=Engystomops pustulosus TaxID=76066 RepID=A0AAV7C6C6_ENGPU|nr:hypothetical protein GDO81_007314 [Engystomops pustulosus]
MSVKLIINKTGQNCLVILTLYTHNAMAPLLHSQYMESCQSLFVGGVILLSLLEVFTEFTLHITVPQLYKPINPKTLLLSSKRKFTLKETYHHASYY